MKVGFLASCPHMGQHYTQMIINTKTTSADDILTLRIDLYHCSLCFLCSTFKACSELRAKQGVQKAARWQTN